MKSKKLSLICSIGLVLVLVLTTILAACAQEAAEPGAPTRISPQVPSQPSTTPATPTTPTTPAKPAPAPAAEVFKWKCQAAWVPTAFEYSIVDEYFKVLEEASGGRVVITQYPGGALIPTAEHFDAIKEGIIEMVNSTCEYWPGMMPEAVMEAGFPATWRNIQDMEQLFYRAEPRNLTDVMREAYAEQDIYAVAYLSKIGFQAL